MHNSHSSKKPSRKITTPTTNPNTNIHQRTRIHLKRRSNGHIEIQLRCEIKTNHITTVIFSVFSNQWWAIARDRFR